MRRKWLVLPIVCLFLSGASHLAAQNPDGETDTNLLTVCELDNTLEEELFDRLAKELDTLDITVSEVDSGDCLLVITHIPAEDVFWIRPNKPESLPLSPILISLLSSPAETAYTPLTEASDEITFNAAAGLALYALEQYDRAVPYFDAAQSLIEHDRLNAPTVEKVMAFYMGNCRLMQGDYRKAALAFEFAIQTMSEDFSTRESLLSLEPAAAVNLAWTSIQLGEVEKAFELMNRLVDMVRKNPALRLQVPDALAYRARIHALAFDYDAAIADMDAAIQLVTEDSQKARFYVLRGQMILLLYEWDRVLADYNTAIELDPDYADAYFYRGVLFYTQVRREEALADFEYYLELAPDGEHAAEAASYVESIAQELKTLDGE